MSNVPSEVTIFYKKDISNIRIISEGGESEVYLGFNQLFGSVAIKVYSHIKGSDRKGDINVWLHRIQHPNILPCLGIFQDSSIFERLAYVFEHSDFGSLSYLLHNRPDITYNITDVYNWCLQACRGLAFLHSKNLLHKDVKPENMLLFPRGILKICDFGLLRTIGKNMTFERGSYDYMAPEIFNNKDYDEAVDVYSMGISIHEILVRSKPYKELSNQTFTKLKQVHKGMRPPINKVAEKSLIPILTSCWNADPSVRPKMKDLVEIFYNLLLSSTNSCDICLSSTISPSALQEEIKQLEPTKENISSAFQEMDEALMDEHNADSGGFQIAECLDVPQYQRVTEPEKILSHIERALDNIEVADTLRVFIDEVKEIHREGDQSVQTFTFSDEDQMKLVEWCKEQTWERDIEGVYGPGDCFTLLFNLAHFTQDSIDQLNAFEARLSSDIMEVLENISAVSRRRSSEKSYNILLLCDGQIPIVKWIHCVAQSCGSSQPPSHTPYVLQAMENYFSFDGVTVVSPDIDAPESVHVACFILNHLAEVNNEYLKMVGVLLERFLNSVLLVIVDEKAECESMEKFLRRSYHNFPPIKIIFFKCPKETAQLDLISYLAVQERFFDNVVLTIIKSAPRRLSSSEML